jgi:hypothetical protein
MKHRTRRRLLKLSVILWLIVISFGSAEIVARQVVAQQDSMLHQPSGDVLDEIRHIHFSADAISVMSDFRGKYVNIVNHERVTIGQPKNAAHSLYLFGDSMAFDYIVDDAHTLANYLQVMLPSYSVHNMGVLGDATLLSVARIKQKRFRSGDVILLYTGMADLMSLYTPIGDKATLPVCNFRYSNLDSIALARLVCAALHQSAINPTCTLDATRSAAQAMINQYHRAVNSAASYVQSFGASFYAVVQPTMYLSPLSDQERGLGSLQDLDCIQRLATYYPQLVSANRSIDLIHALDSVRAAGVVIYTQDRWHINERGNAIIARTIYDAIWQSF